MGTRWSKSGPSTSGAGERQQGDRGRRVVVLVGWARRQPGVGMIRSVRSVALVVILSALALGAPQLAARADTLPTVASGGGSSSGWAAIAWTVGPGAQGSAT